jgi:hypothetical protein
MRKRTGLRNRHRNGRSTYSVKNKRKDADRYGSYDQGKLTTAYGHKLTSLKSQ